MDPARRPPALNIHPVPSSSPSPASSLSSSSTLYPSASPRLYSEFDSFIDDLNEKALPLTGTPGDRTRSSPVTATRHQNGRFHHTPTSSRDYQPRTPRANHASSLSHSQPSSSRSNVRSLRLAGRLRPWIPLAMYGFTSLGFVIAIAFYRPEVFALLDDLSRWLKADEKFGYAVLFSLIFFTTIPPMPLYSTLITLSGYTFGPWTGAIISYFAALSGALAVFVISRSCFRGAISRWLSATITIKRVVRAVEKRPKLLFLIRLAPYPYNVMNCLLAAAPTLTLRTYTICTGLSLFKVIIHTSMGASIHSFKDYHVINKDPSVPHEHTIAEMWTALGIMLCVATLVYLSFVARKAVDDELDDEPITAYDAEETIGFLSPNDPARDVECGTQDPPHMLESPFRSASGLVHAYRSSMEQADPGNHWIYQAHA